MRKQSDGGAVPASDVVGQTWKQMTVFPPTHVKFNLLLWLSTEEDTFTLSCEASDPYTNELLARVVAPWHKHTSLLDAARSASKTLTSLIHDVLDPDPF